MPQVFLSGTGATATGMEVPLMFILVLSEMRIALVVLFGVVTVAADAIANVLEAHYSYYCHGGHQHVCWHGWC